ncbi:putative membrane protein [Amycolatopsis xylanica]|uniref:Putative membrane protein n=1 Tax=Amycolatopsis xylanica TaxID=589385 RepID=A0A1H3GKH1_9PSEU|nr:PH domain-containing protein [Amycolatopsis xylanica]SDY03796.1 putative membrane protein [Amycolatopsis xylanica]
MSEWLTLDRRTVRVTALTFAGLAVASGIPAVLALADGLSLGIALLIVVPSALLVVGATALLDLLRWQATRYRLTEQRLEKRFDLVLKTQKSLPRERIRSVDLTANPLHRLFGLAVLTIGTGQHEGSENARLKLDPLTRADAERLRVELLHREQPAERPADGSIAKLDWGWIRYVPASFLAPTLGLAAVGAVFKVADWFHAGGGVVHWAIGLFGELPLVVSILILAVLIWVLGVIGAMGLFVEMWWDFRLEREPGGTLRVHRGLFTTRSISLEEKRLRGVEVVEPIGNRLSGAARVDAIATGMRKTDDNDKTDYHTLLPAAPLALANEVAATVLDEPVSPTVSARLTGHPEAARGRRLRWWLGSVLVVLATLTLLGVLLTDVLLIIAGALAVPLIPLAVALALDAYRNLGHGLTGEYLVSRHGAMRRSTVALQRTGVIGWTIKQSIFQRRKGLLTLEATTAAGSGGYSVYDIGEPDGIAFADQAVPDLLTQFLETSAVTDRSRV